MFKNKQNSKRYKITLIWVWQAINCKWNINYYLVRIICLFDKH